MPEFCWHDHSRFREFIVHNKAILILSYHIKLISLTDIFLIILHFTSRIAAFRKITASIKFTSGFMIIP